MQGQKGGGSLSHLPRRRRHNSQLRHEFNECLLRPVVERDANFPFIFLPRGNGFLTESEARLNSKLIPGRRLLPYPLSLGRDRVSRFFCGTVVVYHYSDSLSLTYNASPVSGCENLVSCEIHQTLFTLPRRFL